MVVLVDRAPYGRQSIMTICHHIRQGKMVQAAATAVWTMPMYNVRRSQGIKMDMEPPVLPVTMLGQYLIGQGLFPPFCSLGLPPPGGCFPFLPKLAFMPIYAFPKSTVPLASRSFVGLAFYTAFMIPCL